MQPENAHYLERARKEAEAFRKLHGNTPPARDALRSELPFIQACVREGSRLYPAAGG